MMRVNGMFYVSLMTILIGMTSCETSSMEDVEKWVASASVGDVAFLPCLASVDPDDPGSWQHPSTAMINYPGDKEGNFEVLLNTTLVIVEVTENDFGLYHCLISLQKTEDDFQKIVYSKALLEKVKTDDDLWQQYRTQLIVAAVAAACTLALFIFIFLVYHFRYKEPKPERLDDKNVYPEFTYRNPSLVTEDEGTGRIKGYTPTPIPENEVNGTAASTHL